MKKHIKVILIVLAVLAIAAILIVAGGSMGLKQGAELQIGTVDLSQLNDGIYTGTYKEKRWTNTVLVEIAGHRIKNITIDKDVTVPVAGVTNEIINRVIEAQSINVDTVSGATVTSKAYLKAIENALNK